MRKTLITKKAGYLSRYLWPGILLGVILVCSPAFGTQMAVSESANEISIEKLPQREQKGGKEAVPAMVFREGKLTVNMPSTTLDRAMKELSRVTGIEVLWMRPESGASVSLGLNDRPVMEAIKHILDGENYMLVFSSQDREEVISSIFILPKGDGNDRNARYSTRMNRLTQNEFDGDMMHEMDFMTRESSERRERRDDFENDLTLEVMFNDDDDL